MKLEVGMYVRFKDKRGIEYIRKIVNISEDNRYASLYLDKEANYSYGLSPKNIIKASHNIIDLIEVGDYVNGRKVVEIFYDANDNVMDVCILGSIVYQNNEIKSAITHEQFEQMAYKVEK